MLYLSSSFPSSTKNPHSLPWFVPDGLYHWFLVPRGYDGILRVLECYSLPIPMVGCSYFLEVLLLVLSKVCSLDIGLVLAIHILRFLSYHNSPLKPHFSFFLGKGGFGNRGEAFWHASDAFPRRDVFSTDVDMILTLWNQ